MKFFLVFVSIYVSIIFVGCSAISSKYDASIKRGGVESVSGVIPAKPRVVSPHQSKKKGVGTWGSRTSAKKMLDVSQGASWYYTWWPHERGVVAPESMEFVPMIYTREYVKDDYFEMAKQSSSGVLLGFNEPDRMQQAGMSVEEAWEHWPKFEATGLRLGSPSMAGNGEEIYPFSWLKRFLAGNENYKPRVDFICIHRYPHTRDPEEALNNLKYHLDRVYEEFGLPIWLTEYSMIHFHVGPDGIALFPTEEAQAQFARESSELLESLPYVERYAWFVLDYYTAERGFDVANIHLYDKNGDVTRVGRAYRDGGRVLPEKE